MIDTSSRMAERFVQHSNNADGSAAKSFEEMNDNTKQRKYAENQMKGTAQMLGKSLDSIVTKVLTDYPDQLRAFIVAHEEYPIDFDPVKMALQATILRAKDIAKQATSMDVSDDSALQDIEMSESAAQSLNTPDNESVLTFDAQAAMKIAMDHMLDLFEASGGNGTLSDMLKSMDQYAIDKGNTLPLGEYASYFDLPGLATIPVNTSMDPITGMPSIVAGPAPATNTSGIVNTSSGSSIFDKINSIITGIGSVAWSVKDAANSVGQAGNAINQAGGSIGASAIQQYLKNNTKTIILAIVGVALLLFLVIYAAKKSK